MFSPIYFINIINSIINIENFRIQVNCTKVLILAIIGEICCKHIGENNYLHQKFETLELYGYGEVTKNFRALWFGIYIVLLALIFVTLITYLTNNVKGERKTIGIYTAIGICNRDISNIYLLENTIINGSAVVLAVLLSCGVRTLINRKICSIAKVKGFQCFSINWGSWILIAILLLLIGYMITYIPMKQLLKKESITLLNQLGK